jgi:hypothetical protein
MLNTIKSITTKDVPAILTIKTIVKMNKKDVETKTIPNPFDVVEKTSKMKVLLNPSYEEAVRDATNDQSFQAGERQWGENIGNGLVDKDGTLYLSFIAKENLETTLIHQGKVIQSSEIKPFLPKKKDGEPVVFRSVKFENIVSLELA